MRSIIIGILVAVASGCSNDYIACNNERYADIRKEYMDVLSTKPNTESEKKKKEIECNYNNKIIDEIISKKEFRGIVQDENGNIISDYKLKVHWDIYNKRNKIENDKLVEKEISNEGFIVRWTNSPDVVSILIQKSGYENQAVNFENSIRRNYEIYLKSGQLKPGKIDGEYVITIRSLNIWSPYGKEGDSIPNTKWPKEISEECPVISTSKDPWITVAPRTGIYVLVDNNLKIYKLEKICEGDDIGFKNIKNEWISIRYRGNGDSCDFDEKRKYYEWRLFYPMEYKELQSNENSKKNTHPDKYIIIEEPG